MFISITTTYTPLADHQVELFSPLSGRVEPLTLTLYIQDVDNGYVVKRNKKAMGVFVEAASEREIPASQWTQEMVDYYESVAGRTLVPKAGARLTTFGKIFFVLAVAFILFVAGAAVKYFTVDKWDKHAAIEEMLKLPVVGDSYNVGLPAMRYDASGKPIASSTEQMWCKVIAIESGGIYLLQIEGQLPEDAAYTKDFADLVSEDGTFRAMLDIEEHKDTWPRISFFPVGSHQKYGVFFYGSVDKAKRPAK